MADDASPYPPDREPNGGIDTTVPHSARIWNYWLGGKDNYAVDRAAAAQFEQFYPGITDVARSSREFLIRAVQFLAGDVGIRQFLDVGTGLPTADNTHEVAQRVAPESRIVYVDYDPLVLTHARALLTSTPQGKTAYVDADMGDPATVMRAVAETLDLARPVALMMMGVLGHVTGYDAARTIVSRLLEPLPSGSYLVLYDDTDTDQGKVEALRGYSESGAVPYHLRSREQIAGFFDGLELVEPGLVFCPKWRPDATTFSSPGADSGALCAVGRKP